MFEEKSVREITRLSPCHRFRKPKRNPAFVNSSGLRRLFENVHFRYSVDGRLDPRNKVPRKRKPGFCKFLRFRESFENVHFRYSVDVIFVFRNVQKVFSAICFFPFPGARTPFRDKKSVTFSSYTVLRNVLSLFEATVIKFSIVLSVNLFINPFLNKWNSRYFMSFLF